MKKKEADLEKLQNLYDQAVLDGDKKLAQMYKAMLQAAKAKHSSADRPKKLGELQKR